jgi:hypothetical protein
MISSIKKLCYFLFVKKGGNMLANNETPIYLLKKAILFTVYRLEAAADLGLDYSVSDREFFREESQRLLGFAQALSPSERGLEDFELNDEQRLQVRVQYGDKVLDDGFRTAKATAKTELKFASGLGHEHAFGNDASEVTEAPKEVEPRLVLDVVKKLADLADFPSKVKCAQDLTERATQQQRCLDERAKSQSNRAVYQSKQTNDIDNAVKALSQSKSAMELRFPRNKAQVVPFFYDVAPTTKKRLDKRLVAIYANLEAHGVSVENEVKERLEAETQPEVLETWLERSVKAKVIADLFGA